MSFNNQLEILKLTYCGFSAKIIGTDKVVYGWKFPPTVGNTQVPDLNLSSSAEELTGDSHVSKETFVQFVKSEQTRQANGSWKGGSWGENNFTVTSNDWFAGMYVQDQLQWELVKTGIIKFSPSSFASDQIIIPGTELSAWSCNGIFNGKSYAFYMTDNPMPQKASDTLWMWGCNSNDEAYREICDDVKVMVMTRGVGLNVDCGGKKAPAAGEHLEPGQPDDERSQVVFATIQEIGIAKETLSKCYIIPMGIYNSPGRDPRYWTYSAHQNGQLIYFGIARESSSIARILYIESDVKPETISHEDTKEIKGKKWVRAYSIFDKYPESEWMLEDHMKFIPDSIGLIRDFRAKSQEEKEKLRF